ncbi:MAG: hypothetical protein M1481_00805 [Candidatus Thermoplasmatota archaeon]|jgi:DNA repair exonuclease SbcCD ATPase subunit|nr:hypothetical protein [Candidatus Thermoplasmatota archaeon]MCL5963801.1 hypothetical protein [Candidatus Thermoplasmatota archaeon]
MSEDSNKIGNEQSIYDVLNSYVSKLRDQEKSIADKNKELNDKNRELAEKDEKLRAMEIKLKEELGKVEEREKRLNASEEKVRNRESEIAIKESDLKKKIEESEKVKHDVSVKIGTLTVIEGDINKLLEALKQKEQEIVNKITDIEARGDSIATLILKLRDIVEKEEDKNKKIDTILNEYKSVLDSHKSSINEIDGLHAKASELVKNLKNVETTFSKFHDDSSKVMTEFKEKLAGLSTTSLQHKETGSGVISTPESNVTEIPEKTVQETVQAANNGEPDEFPCPKCGTMLTTGSVMCYACGAEINDK